MVIDGINHLQTRYIRISVWFCAVLLQLITSYIHSMAVIRVPVILTCRNTTCCLSVLRILRRRSVAWQFGTRASTVCGLENIRRRSFLFDLTFTSFSVPFWKLQPLVQWHLDRAIWPSPSSLHFVVTMLSTQFCKGRGFRIERNFSFTLIILLIRPWSIASSPIAVLVISLLPSGLVKAVTAPSRSSEMPWIAAIHSV